AVRSAVRASLQAVDGPVFVACSGGADSVALAAATAFVAPRLGIAAGLVTVDHGLQQGSDAVAARVAALGYELGFDPVLTVPVQVTGPGGPEAAARDARYAVLWRLGTPVLLGHTLDDQAETVLLGLGRGSGPRSIAGMRAVGGGPAGAGAGGARGGPWRRPFLGLRRATTARACHELGLPVWQDPHNEDPGFRRVRLRREVLPLLEDVLGGGVAQALARTATLLQDDLDALDALTPPVPTPPSPLEVAAVTALPRALRTRVLRAWAAGAGAGHLDAGHTAALDTLVARWHGQGPLDLPGGVRVVRRSGKLVAMHREEAGR
ncbi:MAG: tRNA lysidine(34) synthetase TilS, partial [Jatrophihabitans sp.]